MPCRHWNTRRFYHGFSRDPSVYRAVWFCETPKISGGSWFRRPRDMYTVADEWLETHEDARGFYWCETTFPPGTKPGEAVHGDDIGWTYLFTNADTAFAFKMRFG